MTWDEYWNKFKGMSRKELLACADLNTKKIFIALKEKLSEKEILNLYFGFINVMYHVDGSFDFNELTFFKSQYNGKLPLSTVLEKRSSYVLVDGIIDKLDKNIKMYFCDLGACIACCNGKLEEKEKALILKFYQN